MASLTWLTQERSLYWPFDRRAMPTYVVIAAMALAGLLMLWLRGFTLSPVLWRFVFGWPLLTVFGGWGLRRIGWPRFAGAMEVTGIFYGQGLSSFLCIVPLASLSAPFADNWLAAIDQALGFDWIAYAQATASWDDVFALSYKSFIWQPVMVAFVLFLLNQSDRCWQTVLAATIGLGLTAMLFPFAPAVGSSVHYGFTVFTPAPPFADVLMALKSGVRTLDQSTFKGLISFPSYHAAAAIIFAWSCWKTWLRWPVAVLNLLVCASAITMGSHYLIDIIAGLIVGLTAIWVSGRVLTFAAVRLQGANQSQA